MRGGCDVQLFELTEQTALNVDTRRIVISAIRGISLSVGSWAVDEASCSQKETITLFSMATEHLGVYVVH